MKKENPIEQAVFNDKVCVYWLMSVAMVLTLTFIGIPLLLLWFPLGLMITRRYLASMECALTERTLKVKKGILVRTEKTIPLEKITDVGMVQGPLMRRFGIHMLTFETAGQSAPGALVSMTGIVDPEAFREKVLSRRDAAQERASEAPREERQSKADDATAILADIRDSLLRIEKSVTSNSATPSDITAKD